MGNLRGDLILEKYGFDFLKILVGRGNEVIRVNTKTGRIIEKFYEHTESIINKNGSEISTNYLCHEDMENISGIIITSAYLYDEYNKDNTVLFINPYARNQIEEKDFESIVYWKKNEKGEYIPYFQGKNIWREL